MASPAPAPAPGTVPPGHPRGLSTLFFTEMWERFSFYGMRAIFVPFMGLAVAEGGLGFDKGQSGSMLALYMSAVYMMSLPGGWIADKFLGQKRAVMLGGLIIMIGHILLALPALASFYAGLGCLVIGTGFLKPNVSSMVGQLYAKGDPCRDGGFSIFYMGINIGAFAAPIICGFLARSEWFKGVLADAGINPHYSWHIAFGAAAVGMAVGLTQFWFGRANLAGVGDAPSNQTPTERSRNQKILAGIGAALVAFPALLIAAHHAGFRMTSAPLGKLMSLAERGTIELSDKVIAMSIDQERISNVFGVLLLSIFCSTFYFLYRKAENDKQRKGVLAMIALAIGCVAFFALFEQAAGVMNSFADERTNTSIAGREFPAEWFQSVNSVFIMLLSAAFAAFFTWVVAKNLAFNDIKKFGVALIFMGLAFVVMLPAAGGKDVSPWFLVGFYFFSTVAELFLSPVGLSSMSKLAPPSAAGLVMGVWFLSTSNGDWLAGKAHALTETMSEGTLFSVVIVGAFVVAALMFALGSYFTRKVPLESLHQGHEAIGGDGTIGPVAASQATQVTGNGIAGFATAAALWPVVLTDERLGLAITIILGPSALLLAFKGMRECKGGGALPEARVAGSGGTAVGGYRFSLITFPLVAGALLVAIIKNL
jgi:POT family proton-dependent oligopeptide transporter